LYLIGAEFIEFRKDRDCWPWIAMEGHITLPEYLSKDGCISDGLADQFNAIKPVDFIYFEKFHSHNSKRDKEKPRSKNLKWDEIESNKHLLLELGLDEYFVVNNHVESNLTATCYSFCIPLLAFYNDSNMPDCDKMGMEVIENTLLRESVFRNGNNIEEIQVSEYWKQVIDKILESSYIKKNSYKGTKKKKITENIYCPTPFIKILEQAAGQQKSLYLTPRIIPPPSSPSPDRKVLEEEDRDDFVKCFRNRFREKDEKVWISWIEKVNLNDLKHDLDKYLHEKTKHYGRPTESNVFRRYLRSISIDYKLTNYKGRQVIYKSFATKMEFIIKELQGLGYINNKEMK
jgi:hypothetical protein